MMSLSPILKMLGVNVSAQDIANIEALIPQVPGKVSEVLVFLNTAVTNFHQRLTMLESSNAKIESQLEAILQELRNGRTDNLGGSESTSGTGDGNGSGQHLPGNDGTER